MKIITDLSVTAAPHRARQRWSPERLFRSGARGLWLDPSHQRTLRQSPDGTNPVSAPGQPVGRIADRSGNGLHASNTATARPVFGVTPADGRRNLSPLSEPTFAQLSTRTGVSDAAAGLSGFDGTIQFPGGAVGNRIAYRDHGVTPSAQFTLSCFVQMDDGLAPVPGSDFVLVIGNMDGTGGYHVPVDLGGGIWRVARTATSLATGPTNTGVLKTDTLSARGFRVSGIQVEMGSSLTAYQRVRSAFDVTEAGVPSLRYLAFDGVDDSLLTGTLDLTHTSQVTLIAGVEKSSNPAVRGTVVNFVDNGFRSFTLEVPQPTTSPSRWLHAGATALRTVSHPLAVAERVIYTGTSNLAAPMLGLRANGAPVASDVSVTGGGPFRSGPLCIGDYVTTPGRRFHGRIFGLVLIDRLLSAPEIARVEAYMAQKAGVML